MDWYPFHIEHARAVITAVVVPGERSGDERVWSAAQLELCAVGRQE